MGPPTLQQQWLPAAQQWRMDEEGGVMRTIGEVIRRQFGPQLEMVRAAVQACPEEVFDAVEIGVREHLYHALVGMDIWLTEDLSSYPFDGIVDDDAAQMKAVASAAVSRRFLLEILDRLASKVSGLPGDDAAYLSPATIRGREFTFLDRCISQFRHVQHHLGVFNEAMRAKGLPTVSWLGFQES